MGRPVDNEPDDMWTIGRPVRTTDGRWSVDRRVIDNGSPSGPPSVAGSSTAPIHAVNDVATTGPRENVHTVDSMMMTMMR